MDGGLGDDLYRVDSSWDTVVEEFEDGGSDTIETTVDFTELGENFENLILSGTSTTTTQVGWGNARNNGMAGNNLNNQLAGWDGDDLMGGRGGDDTVNGGGGHDTLLGGDGNDVLMGASGNDFMIGGNGADLYSYGRAFGQDIINDGAADGAQDIILFSSTMDYKTLWFTKAANNDLIVSQIGTSDQITVAGWFNSTQNHVELFEIGSGATYRTMTDGAVQGLVNAMATMTPPPAGQTSLTSAQWATLQPAMDQAWLFPEIG
jgi:Ca2+-binding RTX toxin-like protein